MNHVAQVSGLNVSTYTPATLKVDQSISVHASPETIWNTLSDQSVAAEWLPSVKELSSVDDSTATADGVGLGRVVVYGSGDQIKETVVYAERNRILAYQIEFPSMVKDHLAIIEITEEGTNLSTIRFYAYFTPTQWTGYLMKYGIYSKIIKSSLRKLSAICLGEPM